MTVEEEHTNFYRTLHGGATSTIVDVVGIPCSNEINLFSSA
jgi:acyl-coenzyme A thioesterase PaaI-like protein